MDLYTPLLFGWARRLGLQQSDAADLVQEVFVVLVRQMPDFDYRTDKRFRGWLWTILTHKHRERQRRRAGKPWTASDSALDQVADPAGDTEVEEAGPALAFRRDLQRARVSAAEAALHGDRQGAAVTSDSFRSKQASEDSSRT